MSEPSLVPLCLHLLFLLGLLHLLGSHQGPRERKHKEPHILQCLPRALSLQNESNGLESCSRDSNSSCLLVGKDLEIIWFQPPCIMQSVGKWASWTLLAIFVLRATDVLNESKAFLPCHQGLPCSLVVRFCPACPGEIEFQRERQRSCRCPKGKYSFPWLIFNIIC